MDKLTWGLAAVSLVGVVANIHKKRYCFYIWSFTNTGWMLTFAYLGVYAHAALSGAYLATSIYGLAKWREGRNGNEAAKQSEASLMLPAPETRCSGRAAG